MIFFHFTSGHALRPIAKYGLTVGDVPTDLRGDGRGRVGVWLTTLATPLRQGLDGSRVDKQRFQLSVDIEDSDPALHKWTDWAPANVTPETVAILHGTAPNFETWYVYFGWVKPERIVAVTDLTTGARLDDWSNAFPRESDVHGWRYQDRFTWQTRMLKHVNKQRRRQSLQT
jgi:hypothetical protein